MFSEGKISHPKADMFLDKWTAPSLVWKQGVQSSNPSDWSEKNVDVTGANIGRVLGGYQDQLPQRRDAVAVMRYPSACRLPSKIPLGPRGYGLDPMERLTNRDKTGLKSHPVYEAKPVSPKNSQLKPPAKMLGIRKMIWLLLFSWCKRSIARWWFPTF